MKTVANGQMCCLSQEALLTAFPGVPMIDDIEQP